ncbi:hypothetical protein ACFX13_043802 [Malus domestica]
MREGGLEDSTIVAVITMGNLAWDGLMILLCFLQGTSREGVSACSQLTVFLITVQPAPNNQLILRHLSYLNLLDFQEGKAVESSQYDLVILHVGAAELESLVGVVSQIEGSKVSHFAAGYVVFPRT